MDDIWVNMNELYQLIRRMRRDDIALVHVSIMPPDELDGETLPACLALSGVRSSDPDVEIEYSDEPGSLEAVPVKSPSVHTSSDS